MRIVLAVVLLCGIGVAYAAEEDPYPAIEALVEAVNPTRNIDARSNAIFLGDPVSGLGAAIHDNFWFSLLVFLPFLILPQILLVYVIVRFRDRGDRRQPAGFIANHRLEILWTAIPIVALLVVAGPAVTLLVRQEAPPVTADNRDDLMVAISGKQFSWVYDYPDYGITGLNTYLVDLAPHGIELSTSIQETVAFELDRVTHLTFTSLDVNHAWGVHAFGIRKDCVRDRINWAWFEPQRPGLFEGQCYELCGVRHGEMTLTAAVLAPEDFRRWVSAQLLRAPVLRIIRNILENPTDAETLRTAIAGYLRPVIDEPEERHRRIHALRWWATYDMAVKRGLLQAHGFDAEAAQVDTDAAVLRQRIEAALARVQAEGVA